MKKIVIIAAVLVLAFGIGSAFAAAASSNSLQKGEIGVSVGMGDSIFSHKTFPQSGAVVNDVVNISGRYFITGDMAILGGLGLQTDGGDANGTYLSISGGFRKYFKAGDFAPFVSAELSVTSVKEDPSIVDLTVVDLAGLFGAEYFLGKQFSLEGSVGIGFGEAKNNLPGGGNDTYFGTRTTGIRANLYF